MGLESNTLPSQQSADLWATGQGGQEVSGGQYTVNRKVVGVSVGEKTVSIPNKLEPKVDLHSTMFE